LTIGTKISKKKKVKILNKKRLNAISRLISIEKMFMTKNKNPEIVIELTIAKFI